MDLTAIDNEVYYLSATKDELMEVKRLLKAHRDTLLTEITELSTTNKKASQKVAKKILDDIEECSGKINNIDKIFLDSKNAKFAQ